MPVFSKQSICSATSGWYVCDIRYWHWLTITSCGIFILCLVKCVRPMLAGPDKNTDAYLDSSTMSITLCAIVSMDVVHDIFSYQGLSFLVAP